MRERVLQYIKDFGYITTYEAFIELGCSRLSEYIRQLRQEYNIEDEWINTTNRYGEKVKYKKYWLSKVDENQMTIDDLIVSNSKM